MPSLTALVDERSTEIVSVHERERERAMCGERERETGETTTD